MSKKGLVEGLEELLRVLTWKRPENEKNEVNKILQHQRPWAKREYFLQLPEDFDLTEIDAEVLPFLRQTLRELKSKRPDKKR